LVQTYTTLGEIIGALGDGGSSQAEDGEERRLHLDDFG
jgi:hypothetical protein